MSFPGSPNQVLFGEKLLTVVQRIPKNTSWLMEKTTFSQLDNDLSCGTFHHFLLQKSPLILIFFVVVRLQSSCIWTFYEWL